MQEPLRVLLAGVGTRGKHWARIMHDEPLCHTVGYMDVNAGALADANTRWPAPQGALFTDFAVALDTRGRARRSFRLVGLPTMVFVDAAGIIQGVHPGPITSAEFDNGLAAILPR